MIEIDDKLSPPDHVFAREFDGEIVVLDLDAGVYYGLNPVASTIWKHLCEDGKTLREVASVMLQRFDVDEGTAVTDVVSIANTWVSHGLVRVNK